MSKSSHQTDLVAYANQMLSGTKHLDTFKHSVAEWLCLLWALSLIDWQKSTDLFNHLLDYHFTATDKAAGLAGNILTLGIQFQRISEAAPDGQHRQHFVDHCLARTIQLQISWKNKLDPDDTGLIYHPVDQLTSPAYAPELQTFWYGSNMALIQHQSGDSDELLELILQNELISFEMNDQLWDPKTSQYKTKSQLPSVTADDATELITNFLPIYSCLPDQDRAEEMLARMRQAAPPWKRGTIDVSWIGAEALLLYYGLVEYDMQVAADELKSYARKFESSVPSKIQQMCLPILWEASN